MGQNQSFRKINFEDMQIAITRNYIIISTLNDSNQKCLIKNTIPHTEEVSVINSLLKTDRDANIIIYGENSIDCSPNNKYKQLLDLGFANIHVYGGGLFEWLLLQDIYGIEEFPTNIRELDVLKYKGHGYFNMGLIK